MLTDRKLLILQSIIEDYIQSAEPVGSRSISKKNSITFSPATIRNDMADLEELGFLEKTHSSSGRIPSQKAYRLYVDRLLLPYRFSEPEMNNIQSLFAGKILEAEEAVKETAGILSELTSYASIVLGPEMFESRLRQIQIVPIGKEAAVAVIVTDTGYVENHTVALPPTLEAGELEQITNILNERLRGIPLYQLQRALFSEVRDVLKRYVLNYEAALSFTEEALRKSRHEKIFYGGKTNLLNQPEFKDVDRVRALLELMEEEHLIHELLKPTINGMTIRIGQENTNEAFEHCSIISATYSLAGKPVGTIGIVGPTRMEYQKVISLVNHLSYGLSNVLDDLYRRDS